MRELRNVLERAAALSEAEVLDADDFARIMPHASFVAGAAAPAGGPTSLAEAVAEVERATISAALAATRGKKAPAAKMLGISRSKLYDKLEALGILSD